MPGTSVRGEAWKQRVGAAVRAARTASGKTQADVGKVAGVDWTTISKIERGETAPDFATIEAIADVLDVSVDALVGRQSPFDRLAAGGFIEADRPLAGTTAAYSGLASIAESVAATPPAASDGSQLRSNSIFYRLESLEADAVDNLRIAKKTRALDAALRALLGFEALPEILRDQLREALGTDESGQS